MAVAEAQTISRLNKLVFRHGRTWISLLAAFACYAILPGGWSILSRVLLSWNTAVTLYLTLISMWMLRQSARQLHDRFVEEDAAAPVIVFCGILAALLSLAAIVQLLSSLDQAPPAQRSMHIVLAAWTVVSSWFLVPTMFTLHYADAFYSAEADDRPLGFPDTPDPVFWDFIYFSFTIAVACQTADVFTRRGPIRKVVIAHSVISFLFNVSILGFAVNVTAGLIGK